MLVKLTTAVWDGQQVSELYWTGTIWPGRALSMKSLRLSKKKNGKTLNGVIECVTDLD